MSKVWNTEDLVPVLAWLDYCVQNDLSFRDTVLEHLKAFRKATTGEEYLFTNRQVDQKLIETGRHMSSHPSLLEIRQNGTACYRELPKDTKEKVQVALARYYELYRGDVPEQYLLSRSLTEVDATSPTPQREEMEVTDKCNEEEPGRNRENVAVPAKNPPDPTSNRKSAKQRTVLAQDGRINSSRPSAGAVGIAVHRRKTRLDATHHQQNQQGVLAEARYRQEIQRKNEQIRTIREQWQQEVDEIRDRESRLKTVELELRAENQHLVIARQERERAGKDPLEYQLFQKNQEIWMLTKRVHETQRLARFTKDDQSRNTAINTAVIDDAMDLIGSEMESIMQGHDASVPLHLPRTFSTFDSGDFAFLIRSLLGQEPQKEDKGSLLRNLTSKFDPQFVVMIMAASALREWVFHTDFPSFNPRDVRLLQAYRKTVMGHDGWSRLHNLELAAFHSLVEEPRFQDVVIPRKASELATRFVAALAPLFPQPFNESQQTAFESWGDSSDVCEDRRSRLTEIFEAALNLKAVTVTTDQYVEFVIHPPGTPDTIERGLQSQSPGHGQENAEAESWLVASFHTYVGDISLPRDPLADALVQTANFVSKSEAERAEKSLHRKDIVIARCESRCSLGQVLHDIPEGRVRSKSLESMSADDGADESDDVYNDIEEAHSPSKAPPEGSHGIHSSLALPILACPVCKRKFWRASDLARHISNNSCARCLQCDKTFCSPSELQRHRRCDHAKGFRNSLRGGSTPLSDTPSPAWECKNCGKGFYSEAFLTRHKQMACPRCLECGKLFEWRPELNEHQMTDHVQSSKSITTAKQATPNSQTHRRGSTTPLKGSKATGKGARRLDVPIKCGDCGRQYHYKSTLHVHRKTNPDCRNQMPSQTLQRYDSQRNQTECQDNHIVQAPNQESSASLLEHSANQGKPNALPEPIDLEPANGFDENTPTRDAEEGSVRPKRKNANRQKRPMSYREESDSDCEMIDSNGTSNSSAQTLGQTSGHPGHRGAQPNKMTSRQDNHTDVYPKSRYNCSVCPRDFATPWNMDRHFKDHPLCIREGKGHIPIKSINDLGKEEVHCQQCDRVLLRGRPTQKQDDTPTTGLEKYRPEHAAGDRHRNTGDATKEDVPQRRQIQESEKSEKRRRRSTITETTTTTARDQSNSASSRDLNSAVATTQPTSRSSV